jgi:hypothetical protein
MATQATQIMTMTSDEKLAQAWECFLAADKDFTESTTAINRYIVEHPELRTLFVGRNGEQQLGLQADKQLQQLQAQCEAALDRRNEALRLWSDLKPTTGTTHFPGGQ